MRAVVFDFDGVLVNSEPVHYGALRDALAERGVVIDEEEYAREYLAYDDRGAARAALVRHRGSAAPEEIEAVAVRKAALFDDLMTRIPLFPGARELVTDLAREMPLAIASGALRREIETMLTGNGLRQAFAAVVGADDVASCKPHPEPYLTAVARLGGVAPGLTPADCVAIEDSGPGIASARAAGLRVVGVAHSYPPDRLTTAHRVVGSLDGLTAAGLRALLEADR